MKLRLFLATMLVAATAPVQAASFFMSTDGTSSFNNSRAAFLGHSVTTNTLAAIIGSPAGTLAGFDVIWVNPGDPDYTALQTGVAGGGSLEQYVTGGGVLVVNVAGNAGDKNDIAPGGVDYSRATLHEAEVFTSPAHPYLTGLGYGGAVLTPTDFVNWSFTDHGTLLNLVGGTTTVLNNTDGPSFVEYQHGAGLVLLNTLTYGWGSSGATGNALNNLINYSAVASAAPIPEPSTYALMIAGLGFVAFVARRRKSAARSA